MSHRLPEPEDVRLARAVMEQHYRQPVRPVEHYCERLASYADALDFAIENHQETPYGSSCGPWGSVEDAKVVRDGLRKLDFGRHKSACLGRLIYDDEPLRTTPCPEHKGRWSGLAFKESDCPHGCQLTGWLPATIAKTKREASS